MSIADSIRADSSRVILDSGFAVQASIGGVAVFGVRSVLKRQDAATLSGDIHHYIFSLLVPASALAAAPHPLKDSAVIGGVSYLILAVEQDVAGNWRIHLGGQYG